MRCALIVLAWMIGVPAAMGSALGVLAAYFWAVVSIARHYGLSEDAGLITAVALICVAFGAVMGVVACREAT